MAKARFIRFTRDGFNEFAIAPPGKPSEGSVSAVFEELGGPAGVVIDGQTIKLPGHTLDDILDRLDIEIKNKATGP